MSTIQANAILDASGGNTTTVNGVTPNADTVKGRNLIINGAMQVAQRGTSQALTSGLFTCDRFRLGWSALDEWVGTMTQVSDSPAGFSNSLKFTTTTPETSIASNEYAYFGQWIEAQNLQHLKFGSASAQSLTVSFWVKSSITGVFGQSIYSADSVRMANATYTINAVNTWEYKTITYTGDTSGAINNDNGEGLRVVWSIAAGTDLNSDPTNNAFESYTDAKWAGGHVQNGIVTTANATIQFTGLQLEVGSVATEFDHRSYGEELSLCQRYFFNPLFGRSTGSIYYPIHFNQVSTGNNGLLRWQVTFPVSMRTSPSLTHSLTDAKFQTSAPNGTDNWAFYRQNSGWSSKAGNSDISVLNIAPSVNQANVGAYYVTPNDTLATAIGIGGGATFNFSAEI